MPSPAPGRVVGPWPLPSSCQHRAGQAGGRGTGLAAGTGGSQGSGCRGCAEFGAGGWGSREDEGLLSVFWLFGGGQCRDVHGARGRMQGAGASTGCAPCLRGGMHSAAPPRDARHSTHRGCTEQLPRGMHRTAPTRAARHCNHAGGTARHPRGMHIADPGQAAQHGTHTGGTARHPHGTHSAAPGRDAWCRVRDARGGTGRRCWQCREQRAHKAPRAAALPRRAAAALGAWGGDTDT